MKKAPSHAVMKSFEESDGEDEVNNKGKGTKDRYKDSRNNTSDIGEQVARMSIHKTEPRKRCEEFSCERHGLWTRQQKASAAMYEKQLMESWNLEDFIEEQLNSFQGYYSKSMTPTRLKDVAQLQMPRELRLLNWLPRPGLVVGGLCHFGSPPLTSDFLIRLN